MRNLLRVEALNRGIDALRELGLVHKSGWDIHHSIIAASVVASETLPTSSHPPESC